MYFTFSRAFLFRTVVLGILLFCAVGKGYGQRVYATGVTIGGTGVTNPNSATSSSTDGTVKPTTMPRAKIQVKGEGGLFPNNVTGWLQLSFPSIVSKDRTVFIKIANDIIANGLSGGSIVITAYLNGGSVIAPSAVTRIVDSSGDSFYAVQLPSSFNQIRITATGNGALLGLGPGTATIEIHYAFHESPNLECSEALGTSMNISGVTLGAGINNIDQAIDRNLSTFSDLYMGVGLGSTVMQTVYFPSSSNVGDVVTITVSVPPALISAGLLGNTKLELFNGNQSVGQISLSSLLQGTDLLGLLQNGQKSTFSFKPAEGEVFDHVSVSVSSLLGLATHFYVWEVTRTPAKPTVPIAYPEIIEVCDGESTTITATSSMGSILRWYNAVNEGTLLQESTGNSDTYVINSASNPLPVGTTFIYVASTWNSGCPAESERTKIAIEVKPKPTVSAISGNDHLCEDESTPLTSASTGGIWSSSDGAIATVNSSGLVSGLTPGDVIIRYTVTDSGTDCSAYQEKAITVYPAPGTPEIHAE